MRGAKTGTRISNLASSVLPAFFNIHKHASVKIRKVVGEPRSPDRRRIKGVKAEEEDARLAAIRHIRPHIQLWKSREYRHGWHPAEGHIGHVERRDRDPSLSIEQIQSQLRRNQCAQLSRCETPM